MQTVLSSLSFIFFFLPLFSTDFLANKKPFKLLLFFLSLLLRNNLIRFPTFCLSKKIFLLKSLLAFSPAHFPLVLLAT